MLREKRCCPLDMDDPSMGASKLLAGAFVARKSVVDAIGGYDPDLQASQNQDLGLRLVSHVKELGWPDAVLNTDHIVMDVFTEAGAARRRRYGSSRADAARVFQERFRERLAADPQHAAALNRIIARAALDEGDFREFRKAAYAAVRAQPSAWANWRFLLAASVPRAVRRVIQSER